MKKVGRWLDKRDSVEIITDEKQGQVYLLNRTKLYDF
jgi:hypothetical protein